MLLSVVTKASHRLKAADVVPVHSAVIHFAASRRWDSNVLGVRVGRSTQVARHHPWGGLWEDPLLESVESEVH